MSVKEQFQIWNDRTASWADSSEHIPVAKQPMRIKHNTTITTTTTTTRTTSVTSPPPSPLPHMTLFLQPTVVKASASRTEDPGFESRMRWDFLGSSHTSDLKIGTPVATLPGTWRYRVSARTGWPGVSILWLGEMESLV